MADARQHDVNIGLIQANSHLGDIAANTDKIIQMLGDALPLWAQILLLRLRCFCRLSCR